MRDSARHLAEHSKAFLLHDSLLSLTQIVIRLLQGAVDLRLVRSQRYVFAELPQELAFTTAEAVGLLARGNEYPEDLAFEQQRRCDECTEATTGEAFRERKVNPVDILFVNQMAAHALRQTVLIDADVGLVGHRQFQGKCFAANTDAIDHNFRGMRIVQAHAAEVDRQTVFQAPNHYLEDAANVLALTDRAGNLIQKIQALQLLLQCLPGALVMGDFRFQRLNRLRQFRRSFLNPPIQLVRPNQNLPPPAKRLGHQTNEKGKNQH